MLRDHNLQIPERDYRDLDHPSYSMLASISKHGIDIMTGVKNNMFNLKFGSLVDDMCFEPELVDRKYYRGTAEKIPTGNPRLIMDIVAKEVLKSVSNNPFLSPRLPSDRLLDHKVLLLKAAKRLKVYKSYTDDKVCESVNKHRKYFKDKINSYGKMPITKEMWDKAEATANTLQKHPFSKKYFTLDPGIELFYQFKFITEVHGEKVKGMLDCVRVDNNKKIIYPVDLKTGEAPAGEFDQVMLGHKYYIQAALYRQALVEIVANDPDLEGYVVAPFEFLYISKDNIFKPLIWVVPSELHNAAMVGFKDVYGNKHKGVCELIEMYYDCRRGKHCYYTEEVTRNNGRIMLDNILG